MRDQFISGHQLGSFETTVILEEIVVGAWKTVVPLNKVKASLVDANDITFVLDIVPRFRLFAWAHFQDIHRNTLPQYIKGP